MSNFTCTMAFLPTCIRPGVPNRLFRLLISTSSFTTTARHPRAILASSSTRCLMSTQVEKIDSKNPTQEDDNDMFAAGVSLESIGVSPDYAKALSARGITTPTKAQVAVIPLLLDGLSLQVDYAAKVAEADKVEAELAEVGTAEVGTAEVGTVEVGTAEVGTSEVGNAHVDETVGVQTDSAAEHGTPLERPRPPEEDFHDVMMFGAETGSGKTLAYLLPYVETARRSSVNLKAVILVPSRELCWQVGSFLSSYFPDAPRHMVLAGGSPPDVGDVKQVRVIIATPNALLNYFRFSKKADASDKMIVVDEADMLLSGSFLRDVEEVLNQPGMKPFATRKNGELRSINRNRLLFVGATYPHWTGERVKSIVTWMKRRYPDIQVVQTEDIHKRNRQLRSRWKFVKDEMEKMNGLISVLEEITETDKVMVFAGKAETCGQICQAVLGRLGPEDVAAKFGAALELHKNVPAVTRQENLNKFRSGEGRLLFCTDLGSRGLDLGNVTRVVEYDFSSNVVVYLHRIGRTARAGASGRTDHFYDEISRPLADAIQQRSETTGTVVEGVFSRNRSFRKKLKKRNMAVAVEAGISTSVPDVMIDGVDDEEEKRLRG